MPLDNDSLSFEGQASSLPTANQPIVRDNETALVAATRSRNADGEWEIRGYSVYGDGIRLDVDSVDRADLAAVLVEEFDAEDLCSPDYYRSTSPVREGIPVAIAVDGKPAIAAWLLVRGSSREEVAELLSVGARTVTEYLSRFRRRGVGIPDDVDAPAVGSIMSELPPEMDYSGGESA